MLLLLLSGLALGADSAVEELARLRTNIEALSHDLNMEEEALRSRLRSLEAVRTDLEVQTRAEDLAVRTLRDGLMSFAEAATDEDSAEPIVPTVLAGLGQLEALIRSGLPYRVAERLQAISDIRDPMQAGTLAPERAASRMWQLAEDELRLTRENALDRQTIDVEGAEVLADVVRLGMVALYVRTPDGRYGYATRGSGEVWTTTLVSGRTESQQISVLFDAVTKQIRVGFFELPNPLEG
jgi:hypothetical protein